MIDTITTIQEVTLQAKELGLYEYLFVERNLSRDDALNLLEMWGREFERNHKDFVWNGSASYYDEIDKFVQNRLGELKCEDYFHGEVTIGSVISFEAGLYKVKGANGNGLVVEPVGPKGNTWGYFTEISFSNKDKIKVIHNYPDVMDTTQNHDPALVGKINKAWNEKREQFCPILRALYERDIDEITDADSFQIDMWRPDNADGCRDEIIEAFNHGNETGDWKRYNELALEDMCREWDMFADNYLMHIADDLDLKAILYFLRYEA